MIKLYLFLTDIFVPIFFGSIHSFFNSEEKIFDEHFYLFLLYSISLVLISLVNNYYKNYFSINFSEKIKISFITSFFAIFFQLIAYLFYSSPLDYSIVLLWVIIPIIILLLRYLIKTSNKNINNTMIYIIGSFYTFNDHEIRMLSNKGFVIYFYDSFDSFEEKSKKNQENINKLYVINYNKRDLIAFNKDKNYLFKENYIYLNEFMEKYLRKIFINIDNPVLDLKTYSRFDFVIKKILDYLSVIVFIPILIISCIFVFVIKIKNNIKDSLFYKQKRYGFNKKIFNVYKIRTMYANSDVKGNTSKNDSRIYPFALTIRKLRIDELPQIINILFGDMHLVGPRAEWVKLSDEYNININNYNYRHIVRPGITGWAQVIYPYGVDENDSRQKLMYDLYYIKNWSLWLEIEICIKTVMVILDKKGF